MTGLEHELARLPALLSAHTAIAALAAGSGVLISVPLGVGVARRPRWRALWLGFASVVQTIPGLALLALMVPLLGTFGFWPALLALVLYAMLPILRNTVAGLAGVDPALLEAADGIGMTARQKLLRVELPLAAPVILAGIRTAVVWTVGMATLGTPVGQPSLGSFIFGGLQTRNSAAVLVGCGAAAALALSLDAVLGWLQASLGRRRPLGVRLSLAALALVLLAGSLAPWLAPGAATAVPSTPGGPAPSTPTGALGAAASLGALRVGAKTFTEQYILAALLDQRLTRAGFEVERRESLGSTLAFEALTQGELDVYVDYTGTIWSSYMRRGAPEPSWRMLALTGAWLAERGVRQLGALGFENAYCLALRRERALALGVSSLAELGAHAGRLSLGSDYEFLSRPEWARLTRTYGLRFAATRSYDPSFMYQAVARGDVDLITAFSSDGQIASLDLLVLADPARAFPPYDAVLLMSPRVAGAPELERALAPLLGAISVERMRRANELVDRDRDKRTPEQAAGWLSQEIEAEQRR